MIKIHLKRGKEESLIRRHPWVFSGAINRIEGDPAEGDIVDVISSQGEFIARGHYQIGSITVRVLSFEEEIIDSLWWERAIRKAFEVRLALGLARSEKTTCYRLIHGEGDGLPGLIVDIYGSTAVVQCHSVGMYLSRHSVCDALRNVYGDLITAIYDKSSQTLPFNAKLNAEDSYIFGTPDKSEETVLENGNKFIVNWGIGQKTGFFIDQRFNRELVGSYAEGRNILNTFCYTGGFSVYALAGGAHSVVSVDSSSSAIELANKNAEINFGSNANHEGVVKDVFDYLRDSDKRFDLIILDPPAFAKHQRVLHKALQGYIRLNARAISQIEPGGILFTFSCSQAVSKDNFRNAVFTAAAIARRNVRILHQLSQPADHPINIYHPEGEYLKGLVLYVE